MKNITQFNHYEELRDLRSSFKHKRLIQWLKQNQYQVNKKYVSNKGLLEHYSQSQNYKTYLLEKLSSHLDLKIPWKFEDFILKNKVEKTINHLSEDNLIKVNENENIETNKVVLEQETTSSFSEDENIQKIHKLVHELEEKSEEHLNKEITKTQWTNTNKHNDKVSFKIRAGEVYAIAGVEGNGQSELALSIAGLLPAGHAKIILNNKDLSKKSIRQRYKLGISNVPEDRHKHGLVLDLPIDKNSMLQQVDEKPFSTFGFINQQEITKHAINIINKYDVRGTSRGTTAARLLSGGNQQKLIIGREMERDHDLLILVQPTRGMDLGAISFVHEQILKEKANGKAILLISYELDEILGLADTIAVMQNGVILEEGSVEVMTKQHIGELMAGKGN